MTLPQKFERWADTGWIDYSTISTIVGWTSVGLSKLVYYYRYGPILFVAWAITGTSDSINTTISIPYSSQTGVSIRAATRSRDNTGPRGVGLASLAHGTDIITLYNDMSATSWTASGTKETYGQLWCVT